MSIIQGVASGSEIDVGDPITYSLRFNSADSADLNRTFGSGNRKKWTFSGWMKRSKLGISAEIISAFNVQEDQFLFNSSDQIRFYVYGSLSGDLTTAAVFRDVAAYLHVHAIYDSANATAADRFILTINGVRQTLTGSTITLNQDSAFNSAVAHRLGRYSLSAAQYFDGYMAQVAFVDGQAEPATSFGRTSANTGVWVPKTPSGITWGTNGFLLTFSDNSGTTSTTLGKDTSGNANNWTPNNFSVTAGATNDVLSDTPTNGYCVLDGSNTSYLGSGGNVFTNGGLDFAGNNAWCNAQGTFGLPYGKWYFEFASYIDYAASVGSVFVGVRDTTKAAFGNSAGGAVSGDGGYAFGHTESNTNTGFWKDGVKTTQSTPSVVSTAGTVYQVAVDTTLGSGSNKIWFGQAGTWCNSGDPAAGSNPIYSTLPNTLAPFAGILNAGGTQNAYMNFGQRAFAYTPPTGFKALSTSNIALPAVLNGANQFNVVTYTGTGSSLTPSAGFAFQPDLTWIKGRSGATDHAIYDVVRGVQKQIESNTTTDETTETTGLTAWTSSSFTVGALAQVNTNSATYVAWNWKANGAGVSNTAGTITATVSANTTAGVSIATYTGTGANATVGHGLGVAPSMVIVKARTTASTDQGWPVYHSGLTSAVYYILLSSNGAQTSAATVWNSTAPTSTVFSVGTDALTNTSSDTYVAYCFAAVAGFSSFGSYIGNGSTDGPFVYCGFRPRWVMWKNTSTNNSWNIIDSIRDPYNTTTHRLLADTTNDEGAIGAVNVDFLASGFKIRDTNSGVNGSTNTIIYAAFAENPFNYSRAR